MPPVSERGVLRPPIQMIALTYLITLVFLGNFSLKGSFTSCGNYIDLTQEGSQKNKSWSDFLLFSRMQQYLGSC